MYDLVGKSETMALAECLNPSPYSVMFLIFCNYLILGTVLRMYNRIRVVQYGLEIQIERGVGTYTIGQENVLV